MAVLSRLLEVPHKPVRLERIVVPEVFRPAISDGLEQQFRRHRHRARVSPKSRLGEKLVYIANHWDRLQVALTDGRVEMDNNVAENAIRPLALKCNSCGRQCLKVMNPTPRLHDYSGPGYIT